jgi:hypothetical protein
MAHSLVSALPGLEHPAVLIVKSRGHVISHSLSAAGLVPSE